MTKGINSLLHCFVPVLLACAALAVGCQRKAPTEVTITFRIVASSVPDDEKVYITGNLEELGMWSTDAVAMEIQEDGSWTKSVTVPYATLIEYKITRGTWESEILMEGKPILKNLMVAAKKNGIVDVEFSGWKDQVYRGMGGVTGTIVRHEQISGPNIPPRDILVWLPPSYKKDTARRYPVLYVHDGQNCFDPTHSFAGEEWKLDEAADRLISKGKMQEIIMVGIFNSPDRDIEYDDTQQGQYYMNFVVNHLKPFIDKTYRTLQDRENTATLGSSLGGLSAFLLVWYYDDVFSQAGCMSPAFFKKITRTVQADTRPKRNVRIYIDNGGVGLDAQRQEGVNKVLTLLKDRGFTLGEDLEWFQDELADHNERAWAARVWRPLLFMYGVKP
ncbi:MAG: histidine kinase [Verrucomicrobia bacterium]|nr:histidine kinase [Verrucomicrobiota bacterium]